LLANHRLLTLTGPAGIGKTRLALRIAEELAPSFPEGVCFVPLVELTAPTSGGYPALVAQAVALALGAREQPVRSLAPALTDSLSSQSVLLVWDNCDYVAEGCRAPAQALLDACPQAKILAARRRSLRIQGATLCAVAPFSFPVAGFDQSAGNALAELLLEFEAPDLFQHRAGAILTGFTIQLEDAAAVAQICRRLDGIPLVVELAPACCEGTLCPFRDRTPPIAGRNRRPPLHMRSIYYLKGVPRCKVHNSPFPFLLAHLTASCVNVPPRSWRSCRRRSSSTIARGASYLATPLASATA
jgi:non-specific serine/threonine protein kinase